MKRYMTDYDDYDDDDDSEGYSNAVDLIQSSVKGHYNRRTKLKTYRSVWFLSKTSLKPLKFHAVLKSRYHKLCNDLIIAQHSENIRETSECSDVEVIFHVKGF